MLYVVAENNNGPFEA